MVRLRSSSAACVLLKLSAQLFFDGVLHHAQVGVLPEVQTSWRSQTPVLAHGSGRLLAVLEALVDAPLGTERRWCRGRVAASLVVVHPPVHGLMIRSQILTDIRISQGGSL